MRFEVDACLLGSDTKVASRDDSRSTSPDDISALAGGLSSLNIAKPSSSPTTATEKQSTPKPFYDIGSLVQQQSLIELTTVGQNNLSRSFDWTEAVPQLYLSQTPHLFLGIHERGIFKSVRKHHLDSDTFLRDKAA